MRKLRPAPPKGFRKGDPRASLAGKKSKRPPMEGMLEARQMNAIEFERIIYKYFDSPIEKLKEIYQTPQTPSRELVVIRILIAAIEKADFTRLNFLLERTIGKVKEQPIDHNINMQADIDLKSSQNEEMIDSLKKLLNAAKNERGV